jgi:hypothetical protein
VCQFFGVQLIIYSFSKTQNQENKTTPKDHLNAKPKFPKIKTPKKDARAKQKTIFKRITRIIP